MNTRNSLSNCPLFSGLPEDQIIKLEHIAQKKSVKQGKVIFFENDPGDGFYIVISGQVKVYKIALTGKEQILHIIDASKPFGEAAVFQGRSFPANAEALSDSELLYFPKERFLELITEHPQLALNMLGLLSARLRKFTRQIEDLSLREVPQRLANYIIYLVENQKNEETVNLQISKGQLASLLGTAPETLSRILTKFVNDGILKVSNRVIEIVDYDALKEIIS